MEPRYRFRLYILTAVILIGAGTLLSRLYNYQIERKKEFDDLVPGETTITIREPGVRGTIVDRNGTMLDDGIACSLHPAWWRECIVQTASVSNQCKIRWGRSGDAPTGTGVALVPQRHPLGTTIQGG